MQFQKLKQTWGDMNTENLVFRITTPLMALALVIAVIAVVTKSETVVIQPPNMSEEARIAVDDANAGFRKSYGLYVASLLGNVQPGSAEFLLATSEHLFHPSVYQQLRQKLTEQIRAIEENDMSTHFMPRNITYWEDTKRVVVFGKRVTQGRGEETSAEEVTYELEIEIDNYIPKVTYIDIYPGSPERDE